MKHTWQVSVNGRKNKQYNREIIKEQLWLRTTKDRKLWSAIIAHVLGYRKREIDYVLWEIHRLTSLLMNIFIVSHLLSLICTTFIRISRETNRDILRKNALYSHNKWAILSNLHERTLFKQLQFNDNCTKTHYSCDFSLYNKKFEEGKSRRKK